MCSRQGQELGVASTALVVVWTAMYLTGYSIYPTGLHESLLLPYYYTIDDTPVKKMCSAITGLVCILSTHLLTLVIFVHVQFLPVYKPSQEEIDDPKLFANNVRQVMAE